MRKLIWLCLLTFLGMPLAHGADHHDVEIEEAGHATAQQMTHLISPQFPLEILLRIANPSGNTMSLRETCRSLYKIEKLMIPYRTTREASILRTSPEFQALMRSIQEGNPIDLSLLGLPDDIISLNLFFLTRDDFISLGLQSTKDLVQFYDPDMAGQFCIDVNKGRVRPIQHLLVRGKDLEEDYDPVIHPKAVETLKALGIRISCVGGSNFEGIDRLLGQLTMTSREFNLLLWFTSLSHEALKGRDYSSLGDYAKEEGMPLGSIAMVYRDSVGGPSYFITQQRLIRALRTYEAMSQTEEGYILCLAFHAKAYYLVEGLLRLSDSSEALNTIKDIHNLRLSFGQWLFGDSYTTMCKNMQAIRLVTHQDTPEILALLRKFIPRFTQEDYHDAPGKSYDRCLKWHKLSNMYGRRDIKDGLGFIKGEKRQDVFMEMILALSTFEPHTQLGRLKSLLEMLRLEHFAQMEAESTYNPYHSYEDQFRNALTYIYENERRLSPYERDQCSYSFRTQRPEFNPLAGDAANIFIVKLRDIFKENKIAMCR